MRSAALRLSLYPLTFSVVFLPFQSLALVPGALPPEAHPANSVHDVPADEYPAGPTEAQLSAETPANPRFIEHYLWHRLRSVGCITAVDLDADEDMDVVAASDTDNTIIWFEDSGRGRFTQHVIDEFFFRASSVEAADLDGDSDQDIIASTIDGWAIAWWENDGAENFARHIVDAWFTCRWGSTAIADMDKDGDADIVAGGDGGLMGWWENDGAGSFSRHILKPESKLWFLTVGDIDGDGWDDLVFHSEDCAKVRRNLKDGQFSESETAKCSGVGRYLRVVDIDGDGDGDIVSSEFNIAILENTGPDQWGHCGFEKHVICESFEDGTRSWAGDFDDDGDIDVVCGSGKYGLGRIAWWENTGEWSFVEHVIAEDAGDVSCLCVGDMRNDGDMDLLSIAPPRQAISFWERDPQADPQPPGDIRDLTVFSPQQKQKIELTWLDPPDEDLCKILLLRSDNEEIPDPQPGELYRDGQDTGPSGLWCRNVDRGYEHYVDADVSPEQTSYYKAYAYDNAANYSSGVVVSGKSGTDTTPPAPPEYFWVTAMDSPTYLSFRWTPPMDSDLAGFLLVRNDAETFVPPENGMPYENGEGLGPGGTWCYNYPVEQSPPDPYVQRSIAVPQPHDAYYFALYARDRSYNYSEGVMDWTGGEVFPGRSMDIDDEAETRPFLITIFDFDDDGDGDLVTTAPAFEKAIYLWENEGPNGFTQTRLWPGRSPLIITVDVDGDGDEDIVYGARSYDRGIGWFENDRGLRFPETHPIDSEFQASTLAAADFDGDGDADVIATSGYPETVMFWENRGEWGFAPRTIREGTAASTMRVGDADGDGDTDILSFGEAGLVWWINSGRAEFTIATVDEQYIAVYAIDTADIDGDGDTDLITTNRAGEVAWWEKTGGLEFDRHDVADYPEMLVTALPADLDGDGHMDLLCNSWTASTDWWRNDGTQTFSPELLNPHGVPSSSLALYDLDGDGDLDVAGYIGFNLGIWWWENTSPPDTQAPSPVRHLDAVSGPMEGVFLMWEPPLESDFKGILLVRNTEDSFGAPERLVSYADGEDTGPGGLWCRTLPKGVDSYEDTHVAENTRYFYAAYAYDEVPNYSSGAFTIAVTEYDLTPPAQPTNINVNVVFNEVVVTWRDPPDADVDSILVVRCVSGMLPWVPSGERYSDGDASGPEGLWCRNIRKGEQMCVDDTAETGTVYWYAVYAYDEIPNYSAPLGVQIAVNLCDSDWDGLPDKWENDHFGSLEEGAFDDFDGDSQDNLSEFHGGSNPADAQSVPGYAESPWPAPRGNGRRTGCSPYVGAASDKFAWAYCPDNASVNTLAVMAPDGTVYVGSRCRYEYTCVISALTQEGELKWEYEARGQLDESPSVGNDGTVYFGVGLGGALHAVNPDGSKRWTVGIGADATTSSPAIGPDGTIHLTTSANEMRAFSPDGRLRWSFPYEGYTDCELAVGNDGTIYFGTRDGYFYAVNPEGTQKWRFTANGEILHSPAIGLDERIHFGTENGWFYALDPAGTIAWVVEHVAAISTAPAIGPDGTIFYVSGEDLYARRSDGYLKWKVDCSPPKSDPSVDTMGRVYLSCSYSVLVVSPDGDSHTSLRPGGRSGVGIGRDGSLFVAGDTLIAILNREDSDNDALPDLWENQHFGHLGHDGGSDPDNDLATNLEEYRIGTDPTVPEYGKWVEMYRISERDSGSPSVTADQYGNPIVAFVKSGKLFIVRWNGQEWENLGTDVSKDQGIALHGIPDNPSLTVDQFGNPILAWQEEVGFAGAENIYVKRWDGSKWVAVGDSTGQYGISGSPEEECTNPVVIADLFGKPIVAWCREPSHGSDHTLQVKRCSGEEWCAIQTCDLVANVGPEGQRNFDLVPDYQGHPVLVWVDYSSKAILATRSTGQQWEYIGERVSTGGVVADCERTIAPRVALSPSGDPAVAWLEKTPSPDYLSREAHMKVWDGATWTPVGGSASQGGVSNSDKVGNVMLGFGCDGHPFVIWLCEKTVLAREVQKTYARAWDGSTWADMGDGSSSAFGVGTADVPGNLSEHSSPDLAVTSFGEAFMVYKESEAIVLRKFSVSPDSKIYAWAPGGFQRGDVTVHYTLTNSRSVPMDVVVEFSLNGGANWSQATPASGVEGLTDLESSPGGVEHTFVWDSASDVDLNGRNIVRLRFIGTAESIQARGMTSSFFVGAVKDEDNDLLDDDWEMSYFGTLDYHRKSDPDFDRAPNILEQQLGTDPTDPRHPAIAPMATITTPTGMQTGNVSISYALVDYNADRISIRVHYSEDGNNWYRATPAPGGDGTVNLTSSRQGVRHTFVWDSAADLRHTQHDTARIRITPFDTEEGRFGVTGPFTVDNTSPDVQSYLVPVVFDAEVREQSPHNNFGKEGLGVSNLSGAERRTYLWFDLSSLPDGQVSNCQLRMNLRSLLCFGGSAEGAVRIRRAGALWQEGTITWNNQPTIGPTLLGGVSLTEQPLDPLGVNENVVLSWRSEVLDSLVNGWVNGITNEGLVLEMDVPDSGDAMEVVFYSSESALDAPGRSAPRLLFDLEPYPEGSRPTVLISRTQPSSIYSLHDNDELRVELLSFRVEANDLEPLAVDSLALALFGTMNPREDILRMSLFVDSNKNGLYDGALVDTFLGTTTPLSSNGVKFGPLSELITQGQRNNWLLVADFSGQAEKGEYLEVSLGVANSLACRGIVSGADAAAIIEPDIRSRCEIASTSLKFGEFLVDDRRNGGWWILKGSFDGELEPFIEVPDTNINFEPVGFDQDRDGSVYIAMPRAIYKFSPLGEFIDEVYRIPDWLAGAEAFAVDKEDTLYFSAEYDHLYRFKAGEGAVEIPGGQFGFNTITALGVGSRNEVLIAHFWTYPELGCDILKLSPEGEISYCVRNLDKQVGGPFYVRSMAVDEEDKLYVLLWAYGDPGVRIYRIEEDPDSPGDPNHMVFTSLLSQATGSSDYKSIALQHDWEGNTSDLYLRRALSSGQEQWALGVTNVTNPGGPFVIVEGFHWGGRRLAFPKLAPMETDMDGDGIPDTVEDFNGNGLIEPELFETSPDDPSDASVDLDGDGMTHLEEYLAGTDPTLESSRLALASVRRESYGAIAVSWNTMPGMKYQVHYSDDPLSAKMAWSACGEPIRATGTELSFMDVGDAGLQRLHPLSFQVRHRYYKVLLHY